MRPSSSEGWPRETLVAETDDASSTSLSRRAVAAIFMLHAHVMHEGLESFARKRKHPMAGKADKTRTPDGTVHETISSRPTLGVGNLYHGPLRREALERSIDRRLAHTLLAIQKVVVNLIDRKRLASMLFNSVAVARVDPAGLYRNRTAIKQVHPLQDENWRRKHECGDCRRQLRRRIREGG